MTGSPALSKARMLESSLRCFALGWFSLVPLLGLPAAIAALGISWRARASHKGLWNAAHRYLVAGHLMALVGLLVSTGVILLAIAAAMELL